MASRKHLHLPSPHKAKIRELTLRAVSVGVFFGLVFAIINAYLALKVGTTISASIPAAIMSMSVLKLYKNSTILENNTVQTIATIGEALAAGVAFTIPALILLGNSPSITRIFLLSSFGGILGILFMIPMRRFVIIKEQHKLPFPEGTAAAAILKAGDSTRKAAPIAFWGLLTGALYKMCSSVFLLWEDTPKWAFFQNKFQFVMEATPSLLGVGYIIGPRITALMFSGSLLAWWVFIPLIKTFALGPEIIYPSFIPISEMSADQIWSYYVRYIGAGALIFGGLLNLLQILPLIYRIVLASMKELLGTFEKKSYVPRAQRDLSMSWIIPGAAAIILALWLIPSFSLNFFTIVLLVVLGFFFVAITCLSVGLVGTTTSPVSGMTLTVLLITCTIFVLLGWTERVYLISAITMSCVTCCAICTAGTTSQDLKTGHLVGAMPRAQQIAEIIGVILPSLVVGYAIYAFNEAYELGSVNMPAPQASLMAMIAEGVIDQELPYGLVGVGMIIGLILTLLRVQLLPFALGVYLPLSLTSAMIVGGLARAWVDDQSKRDLTSQERGVLLASGLIGGDACIGIVIALMAVFHVSPFHATLAWSGLVGLGFFLLLGGLLAASSLKNGLSSFWKS
ncbi:MAG: oligopeptide transporter, OPT family [Chlamydiales bacterium]|nr:oligopeptide transporter, OPT family [Chlamydiales bacterium]